jgi:hypothetical protein
MHFTGAAFAICCLINNMQITNRGSFYMRQFAGAKSAKSGPCLIASSVDLPEAGKWDDAACGGIFCGVVPICGSTDNPRQ